jgi:hypothetical protein
MMGVKRAWPNSSMEKSKYNATKFHVEFRLSYRKQNKKRNVMNRFYAGSRQHMFTTPVDFCLKFCSIVVALGIAVN